MNAESKGLRTVTLADVIFSEVKRLTTAKALPLFPGYLTALVGPGESGKSWLACHAVLDIAEQGRNVLVCDGEMSAGAWRYRLLALDADDNQLSRIRYTEMTDTAADVSLVRETVKQHDITLIVWDSALSLISRTAQSENDNVAVSRVYDRLREIVRAGPAGLVVDHTSAGASSSISRGATAKFNSLDLSYGVRLDDGSIPGPIDNWSARVTIEKDRHGLLAVRTDRAVLFHPLGGGQLVIDVTEIIGASHRLSASNPVTAALTQIAALNPPPTSANDAYRRVSGRKSTVLAAYKIWTEQ